MIPVLDSVGIIFQHMNVRVLGKFFTHVINACIEFAIVEFVITHNVNHMRELKTTTLEEISKTLCSHLPTTQSSAVSNSRLITRIVRLGMVVEILGDTNITTEDQNIIVLIVNNVNVTEL